VRLPAVPSKRKHYIMKKDWSKTVAELLALHESFRKLKFPAEALFVDIYKSGQVQFTLRHKGETFAIDVSKNIDIEKIQKEWQEAVAWWNGPATEDERQAIYEEAAIAKRRGDLAFALAKRGLINP
jgi:hypothetical protein